MRSSIRGVLMLVVTIGAGAASGAVTIAQQPAAAQPSSPPAAPESRPAPGPVPVRIELSLSRHEGDKRVSNLPFTLLTTVGSSARLRVGSNVPIGGGMGPVNYQSVGTNIDATVHAAGPGRYRLDLRLEESSVAERQGGPGAANSVASNPIIRSNSLNTMLILRDGQTTELVVASDKVSGETIKAEVRVTEIK